MVRTTGDRRPAILLCFGIFILWGFGYETVWLRLHTALEGVVVSRQELPRVWYAHGTATIYVVRRKDGMEQRYVAGANDGCLPRDIPLGAQITKRQWELSYMVDGREIHDFPTAFYAVTLGGALICVFRGGVELLRRRA